MPQSRPTANPRYQEEEKKDKNVFVFFFFFFFYFFQHIKMSKAFTLEKSQKKKNAFCLWHVRLFILLFMAYAEPVYSSFRSPTLPYRAQSLLNATGKMSLNWGLDCTSICSMHAPAEFWTRSWMNNEIWIKKINTGNHEFFLENLILVFGVMTSHFTSSVRLLLIS